MKKLFASAFLALLSCGAQAACPPVNIYPFIEGCPVTAAGLNASFSAGASGLNIAFPFQLFPPVLPLPAHFPQEVIISNNFTATGSGVPAYADIFTSRFLLRVNAYGHGGGIGASSVNPLPGASPGVGDNAFDYALRGSGYLIPGANGNKAGGIYVEGNQYAPGTTAAMEADCGNYLGNPAHYPFDRSFGTTDNICTGIIIAASIGDYPPSVGLAMSGGGNAGGKAWYDGIIIQDDSILRRSLSIFASSADSTWPILFQGKGNASAAAIALKQFLLTAGPVDLDGYSVTAGVAGGFRGGAQNVTIGSFGNDAGVTFTIVGTDAAGAPQTEDLPGVNVGTATSVNAYLTVSSITADLPTARDIRVGISGTSLPMPIIDLQVVGLEQAAYPVLKITNASGAMKSGLTQEGGALMGGIQLHTSFGGPTPIFSLGTTSAGMALQTFATTSIDNQFNFTTSKNATVGTLTAVTTGLRLMSLQAWGADATTPSAYRKAGQIAIVANGNATAGVTPGQLQIYLTKSDGTFNQEITVDQGIAIGAVTGVTKGTGTINATTYYAGGTIGATCGPGAPTAGFTVKGGIVTVC